MSSTVIYWFYLYFCNFLNPFLSCSQDGADVGLELGEEAQVCVQASIAAGQESDPHLLHLQPRRETDRRRLPGRDHPDLGQEPERKCSASSLSLHHAVILDDTREVRRLLKGCCSVSRHVTVPDARGQRSEVTGALTLSRSAAVRCFTE